MSCETWVTPLHSTIEIRLTVSRPSVEAGQGEGGYQSERVGDSANRPSRSIASRIRATAAVAESRTNPSPVGPKNVPGATAMPVCSSNASANVSEVATDDIPPSSHALPLTNVYRPDEVRRCLTPEEALAAAPAVEDDRFRVPRILGEEA